MLSDLLGYLARATSGGQINTQAFIQEEPLKPSAIETDFLGEKLSDKIGDKHSDFWDAIERGDL